MPDGPRQEGQLPAWTSASAAIKRIQEALGTDACIGGRYPGWAALSTGFCPGPATASPPSNVGRVRERTPGTGKRGAGCDKRAVCPTTCPARCNRTPTSGTSRALLDCAGETGGLMGGKERPFQDSFGPGGEQVLVASPEHLGWFQAGHEGKAAGTSEISPRNDPMAGAGARGTGIPWAWPLPADPFGSFMDSTSNGSRKLVADRGPSVYGIGSR